MVRLTADLIWKSPHFFNAIKERELDLRGLLLILFLFQNPNPNIHRHHAHTLSFCVFYCFLICLMKIESWPAGNKIPVIENLGATEVLLHFFLLEPEIKSLFLHVYNAYPKLNLD